MKTTPSEIKKNPQGTNSGEDEARIQINNLEHKDKIRIQPEEQVGKNNNKKKKTSKV